MTNFEAMVRGLAGQNVAFILVGGAAAVAHGSTRLTQDLDIVYARDLDNLSKLVAFLIPYSPYLRGAPTGLPFRMDEKTLQNGLNFTLTTTIGDIDLLGEIVGGGKYEDLISHTIELSVFGVKVMCLDLPTLIWVKRAAGRPKDLETIAELEKIASQKA